MATTRPFAPIPTPNDLVSIRDPLRITIPLLSHNHDLDFTKLFHGSSDLQTISMRLQGAIDNHNKIKIKLKTFVNDRYQDIVTNGEHVNVVDDACKSLDRILVGLVPLYSSFEQGLERELTTQRVDFMVEQQQLSYHTPSLRSPHPATQNVSQPATVLSPTMTGIKNTRHFRNSLQQAQIDHNHNTTTLNLIYQYTTIIAGIMMLESLLSNIAAITLHTTQQPSNNTHNWSHSDQLLFIIKAHALSRQIGNAIFDLNTLIANQSSQDPSATTQTPLPTSPPPQPHSPSPITAAQSHSTLLETIKMIQDGVHDCEATMSMNTTFLARTTSRHLSAVLASFSALLSGHDGNLINHDNTIASVILAISGENKPNTGIKHNEAQVTTATLLQELTSLLPIQHNDHIPIDLVATLYSHCCQLGSGTDKGISDLHQFIIDHPLYHAVFDSTEESHTPSFAPPSQLTFVGVITHYLKATLPPQTQASQHPFYPVAMSPIAVALLDIITSLSLYPTFTTIETLPSIIFAAPDNSRTHPPQPKTSTPSRITTTQSISDRIKARINPNHVLASLPITHPLDQTTTLSDLSNPMDFLLILLFAVMGPAMDASLKIAQNCIIRISQHTQQQFRDESLLFSDHIATTYSALIRTLTLSSMLLPPLDPAAALPFDVIDFHSRTVQYISQHHISPTSHKRQQQQQQQQKIPATPLLFSSAYYFTSLSGQEETGCQSKKLHPFVDGLMKDRNSTPPTFHAFLHHTISQLATTINTYFTNSFSPTVIAALPSQSILGVVTRGIQQLVAMRNALTFPIEFAPSPLTIFTFRAVHVLLLPVLNQVSISMNESRPFYHNDGIPPIVPSPPTITPQQQQQQQLSAITQSSLTQSTQSASQQLLQLLIMPTFESFSLSLSKLYTTQIITTTEQLFHHTWDCHFDQFAPAVPSSGQMAQVGSLVPSPRHDELVFHNIPFQVIPPFLTSFFAKFSQQPQIHPSLARPVVIKPLGIAHPGPDHGSNNSINHCTVIFSLLSVLTTTLLSIHLNHTPSSASSQDKNDVNTIITQHHPQKHTQTLALLILFAFHSHALAFNKVQQADPKPEEQPNQPQSSSKQSNTIELNNLGEIAHNTLTELNSLMASMKSLGPADPSPHQPRHHSPLPPHVRQFISSLVTKSNLQFDRVFMNHGVDGSSDRSNFASNSAVLKQLAAFVVTIATQFALFFISKDQSRLFSSHPTNLPSNDRIINLNQGNSIKIAGIPSQSNRFYSHLPGNITKSFLVDFSTALLATTARSETATHQFSHDKEILFTLQSKINFCFFEQIIINLSATIFSLLLALPSSLYHEHQFRNVGGLNRQPASPSSPTPAATTTAASTNIATIALSPRITTQLLTIAPLSNFIRTTLTPAFASSLGQLFDRYLTLQKTISASALNIATSSTPSALIPFLSTYSPAIFNIASQFISSVPILTVSLSYQSALFLNQQHHQYENTLFSPPAFNLNLYRSSLPVLSPNLSTSVNNLNNATGTSNGARPTMRSSVLLSTHHPYIQIIQAALLRENAVAPTSTTLNHPFTTMVKQLCQQHLSQTTPTPTTATATQPPQCHPQNPNLLHLGLLSSSLGFTRPISTTHPQAVATLTSSLTPSITFNSFSQSPLFHRFVLPCDPIVFTRDMGMGKGGIGHLRLNNDDENGGDSNVLLSISYSQDCSFGLMSQPLDQPNDTTNLINISSCLDQPHTGLARAERDRVNQAIFSTLVKTTINNLPTKSSALSTNIIKQPVQPGTTRYSISPLVTKFFIASISSLLQCTLLCTAAQTSNTSSPTVSQSIDQLNQKEITQHLSKLDPTSHISLGMVLDALEISMQYPTFSLKLANLLKKLFVSLDITLPLAFSSHSNNTSPSFHHQNDSTNAPTSLCDELMSNRPDLLPVFITVSAADPQ